MDKTAPVSAPAAPLAEIEDGSDEVAVGQKPTAKIAPEVLQTLVEACTVPA